MAAGPGPSPRGPLDGRTWLAATRSNPGPRRNQRKGTGSYADPFLLAAGLGFEPRYTDSESAVLPLDDPALFFVEIQLS